MKIKFLHATVFSEDGFTCKRYKVGETKNVAHTAAAGLIWSGRAVCSEKESMDDVVAKIILDTKNCVTTKVMGPL